MSASALGPPLPPLFRFKEANLVHRGKRSWIHVSLIAKDPRRVGNRMVVIENGRICLVN